MRKSRLWIRGLSLLLVLTLIISLAIPAMAAPSESGGAGFTAEKLRQDELADISPVNAVKDTPSVNEKYSKSDTVRVSIVLSGKSAVEAGYSTAQMSESKSALRYRSSLMQQQLSLAKAISSRVLGSTLDVVWNLTLAANIISANVPYGAIERIKALSGVRDVIIENCYAPCESSAGTNVASSSAMTGINLAWQNGYTGAGQRIAIIDTGIDTDHQSFSEDAYIYALHQNAESLGLDYDEYVSGLNLLTEKEISQKWSLLNFASRYSGSAGNVCFGNKLPFGANYVDKCTDISHDNDSQGAHGSHVAGIAAANRFIPLDSGFSEALSLTGAQGVAPDAQLMIMKVFGNGGGAYDSDYMAAIEDAITLGADAVNLSLGSDNAGASANEYYQDILDRLALSDTVVTTSAGNSGAWADETESGRLYSDGVSFDTVCNPSSYTNSFSVASVDNDGTVGSCVKLGSHSLYYTETSHNNAPMSSIAGEHEFIYMDAVGLASQFKALSAQISGKIVICNRGTTAFSEKMDLAAEYGAVACIVVNNTEGAIGMDLRSAVSSIPCVSLLQKAAEIIRAEAEYVAEGKYYTGTLTVNSGVSIEHYDSDFCTMSDFSAFGVPGSLELKPEITAPGGNIYSVSGSVAGGKAYESLSGTSMAAPQIAGMSALAAQYIRENGLEEKTGLSSRQLIQSLFMSTAKPLIEESCGSYYSVFRQGAGLADIDAAINSGSYIIMNGAACKGAADGKVKAELGDDPQRTGNYSFGFTLTNMDSEAKCFELSADFFTQNISSDDEVSYLSASTVPVNAAAVWTVDGRTLEASAISLRCCDFNGDGAVSSHDGQALLDYVVGKLKDISAADSADLDGDGDIDTHDVYTFFRNLSAGTVTVPAKGSVSISVSINLSGLDAYDDCGAYVEGFVFANELSGGDSHSIPVLGYYGSWSESSMFDIGSSLDYKYGLEKRTPYLYAATGSSAYENNFFSIKYSGSSETCSFGGNPMVEDEVYMPHRNAVNSLDGDKITRLSFTPVRNAAASLFSVTDAEGNTVFSREFGKYDAAYYNASTEKWASTGQTAGMNYSPKGIPEGTQLTASFALAPEYYMGADGQVSWDELAGGALISIPFTVDNTAPVISDIVLSEDSSELSFTATDNQYIAAVMLLDESGNVLDSFGSDSQADAGDAGHYSFALESTREKYLVQVYDYAMNCTGYKITPDSGDDTEISVRLSNSALELVKGDEYRLTAAVEPWGIDDATVTWHSDRESVAAVGANGLVTAVGAGTAVITAVSNADRTKSASCTVTVSADALTVYGIAQDNTGKNRFFSWDIEHDSAPQSGEGLENDFSAFAYDWNTEHTADNGESFFCGYEMGANGYMYRFDMDSFRVIEQSKNALLYDHPLTDMDLAIASNIVNDTNIILGIYGPCLLFSDAMENDFSYGFDFSDDLRKRSGADAFTAIAWGGYDAQDRDTLYLMDNRGLIWMVFFDGTDDIELGYFETDLDLEWPSYEDGSHCSMVLGDDNNFYLSCRNADGTDIYKLVYSEDTDSFSSTRICRLDGSCSSCILYSVLPNGSSEAEAASLPGAEGTVLTKLSAKPVKHILSSGGLHSVSGTHSAPAGSDGGSITVEVTPSDMGGNKAAGTNALLRVDYDKACLELAEIKILADYGSVNGNVFGYADLEGFDSDEPAALLRFNVKNFNGASVSITTLEVNNDKSGYTETIGADKLCNHSWGEWEVSVAAGCKTYGEEKRVCSICGARETRPIEPAGHIADPFTDIAASGYHDYIIEAAALGFIAGYPEGTFKPANSVTRGQFVTILHRMAGSPQSGNIAGFTDVKKSSPYYNAIMWASSQDIARGFDESHFAPNASITRAQMATFMYRYLKNTVHYDFGKVSRCAFTDSSKIAAPHTEAVDAIVSVGIMNGVGDGTRFSPNTTANRGMAATVMLRLHKLINE